MKSVCRRWLGLGTTEIAGPRAYIHRVHCVRSSADTAFPLPARANGSSVFFGFPGSVLFDRFTRCERRRSRAVCVNIRQACLRGHTIQKKKKKKNDDVRTRVFFMFFTVPHVISTARYVTTYPVIIVIALHRDDIIYSNRG